MQQLTRVNIQKTVLNIQQFIQDEKIAVSRRTIRREQGRGRWPEDYRSYSGTITNRNSFDNPVTFFNVQSARPKKYRETFTFLPIVEEASKDLGDAVRLAWNIMFRQATVYGVDTGLFRKSFILFEDRGGVRVPIRNPSSIREPAGDSFYSILSPLEYASTIESRAFLRLRIGGVVFAAANRVKSRYPNLAVRFVYRKAQDFGLSHKYDVPLLSIGPRAILQDKLSTPGRRFVGRGTGSGRRRKEVQRLSQAYQETAARLRRRSG